MLGQSWDGLPAVGRGVASALACPLLARSYMKNDYSEPI